MNISMLSPSAAIDDLSEMQAATQGQSLDTMLARAVASIDATAETEKLRIDHRLSNQANFTRPENLIALQTELQNYSIHLSLVSALARKGISTVETVVKGQ